MHEISSEWLKNFQTPRTLPSSITTPPKSANQLPAFADERLEEPARMLLVEGNALSRALYQEAFAHENIVYTIVPDFAAARMLVNNGDASGATFDLLVSEFRASNDESIALIKMVGNLASMPKIIVVGIASIDSVLIALRLGVADYLPLSIKPEQLRSSVKSVMTQ